MIASRSIAARLVIVIGLALGAGAVILGLGARRYAEFAADEAYDRLLVGAAFQIAESIRIDAGRLTVEPPVSAFETLALSANDRIFYKVLDPAGALLTGDADLALPPALPAAGERRLGDAVHRSMPVRTITLARTTADAAQPGTAIVMVAQTREAREHLAHELTREVLLVVAALSLISLASAYLAVRFALRPLSAIEEAIRGRDPQDLTPLTVATPVEVEALVGTINRFMRRLSERLEVMKRFIADAAHQIRTPLTALTAQAELLGAAAGSSGGSAPLERIRERAAELGRLTQQLLNHAMIIHRSETVPLQPVDLVALARRSLAEAVPLTLGREVEIELDAPPQAVRVAGDAVSLREALSNLIDNALKHGAPSRLVLRLSAGREAARLEVFDDGRGVPPEGWASMIRPFQTGGERAGGSGLGLAIVADVVRAHHGRLEFEQAENGFAVIMSLPLAREDDA